MSTQRPVPEYGVPIVNGLGLQTQEFNDFIADITKTIPILGEGSPEGLVVADPGQWFIDQTAAGSGLYVKQKGNGDIGWELV